MIPRMVLQRLKTAAGYWVDDQAAQMGAALAYYTLFSLAPLMMIAIAVAGHFFGEAEARHELLKRMSEFMGPDSARTAETMLDNAKQLPTRIGPALVGIVSLLFGALSVFTQLRASLNRIWRVTPPPSQGVVWGIVKDYLIAFLMVTMSCVFVLALLLSSAVLAFVQQLWQEELPGPAWLWHGGDFLLSTLLITLLFACTFRFMSDGPVHFRHVWSGALTSALLFTAGKLLIGWYLGFSQLGTAYGAAGSLVVFLAWVYYSAQIFFFGAELVRVELEK